MYVCCQLAGSLDRPRGGRLTTEFTELQLFTEGLEYDVF